MVIGYNEETHLQAWLEKATGDYILFVDSDDDLMEGTLHYMVKNLLANKLMLCRPDYFNSSMA